MIDHDFARRVLAAASDAPLVVYDTETDGLDWKRNSVCGYVITVGPAPDQSFYVPIRHKGGANLASSECPNGEPTPPGIQHWFEHELMRIAWDPRKHWIGHNMKFDMHMSANHKVIFEGPLECTQVNSALIDENASSSLESCCARAQVQAKKGGPMYDYLASKFGGQSSREQMAHFHELAGDDPMAVEYATGDGTSTWQLHEWQQKELDKQDLRLVWGVECRVLRTLFRMERKGVRIDEERLAWLEKEIEMRLDRAMACLPKDFNSKAPSQVRKWMEENGVTDWPMTAPSPKFPQGQPSFPEEWLLKSEPGQQIVAVRKLKTLTSSFVTPMKERHLFNGRVHTNFNQLATDDYGVVTGRLSSNDPNLQQVPKRDKIIAPLFRSIFVPEEGHLWYVNDFYQQDLVVFAHYTKAAKIIEGYKQEPPVDIHQTVAGWLGVERDPTAKRMNLGMLNGMGVDKLAAKVGCSSDVARGHIMNYDANFPEAKVFRKGAEAVAKERGYVFTLLKRRRRFPDSRFAHKAGSSIVQGGSADLTKLKMVEVDEYFRSEKKDADVLIQIHDDLDITSGDPAAVTEAQRIMCAFGPDDVIKLSLPMRVDAGVGENWAEATFPKDGKKRTLA